MFSFPVLALAFSWAGSYARLWRCAVGQVVAKAGCALSKTQNTNIKHKHMKSETKYKTHPGFTTGGDGGVFVGQVVANGGCAMRKMQNIKFKQNVGGNW